MVVVSRGPRYQPYLDVAPAPFRWRLGLRPLDLDDWLQLDDGYAADIARKHEVMRDHPSTAFRVLDDVVDESVEVLDAVVEHLERAADPRVPPPDPALHPLDAAARLVQEDLVLLVERDGELVCGGGSVCFPNRWDLASKVGRAMADVHRPVAQLNEQLEPAIDRALARLRPDRSYWRLGWGVLDSAELYQPTDGTAAPRPHGVTPPPVHQLRVERETLRRMPRTECILFTIRTYLCPLGALPGGSDAAALADAIDALPDDVAAYKQLSGSRSSITSWLREAAVT